jgi:hypothetical protein
MHKQTDTVAKAVHVEVTGRRRMCVPIAVPFLVSVCLYLCECLRLCQCMCLRLCLCMYVYLRLSLHFGPLPMLMRLFVRMRAHVPLPD